MQERLQKIIADAGITSRRKAEELMVKGRVSVNGRTITELGSKADPALDRIVVDGRLLVEIKCADQLSNEHLAQCINYLKASGLHLALLINFRKSRVEWRRVVHHL